MESHPRCRSVMASTMVGGDEGVEDDDSRHGEEAEGAS